jgi:DNA-binding Lrp family transcriptional regulator
MAEDKVHIHRCKHLKNFTITNNEVSENIKLSWQAKGLFRYLMKLPNNWKINIQEIVAHATNGEDSVRRCFKELEEAGYITKTRVKNSKGRFSGYSYDVFETVKVQKKLANFSSKNNNPPYRGKPHLEKPHLENPALLSTNILSTEELSTDVSLTYVKENIPQGLSKTKPCFKQNSNSCNNEKKQNFLKRKKLRKKKTKGNFSKSTSKNIHQNTSQTKVSIPTSDDLPLTNSNPCLKQESVRKDSYSRLNPNQKNKILTKEIDELVQYWFNKGLPKMRGNPVSNKTYEKAVTKLNLLLKGKVYNAAPEHTEFKNIKFDHIDWKHAVDNWHLVITSSDYMPIDKKIIKGTNLGDFILNDYTGISQFLTCVQDKLIKVRKFKKIDCVDPVTLKFLLNLFDKKLNENNINNVTILVNKIFEYLKDYEMSVSLYNQPEYKAKLIFESFTDNVKENPNYCKSENVFKEFSKHCLKTNSIYKKQDPRFNLYR